MNIHLIEPMQRAWDYMVSLLFRPFDVQKWLVLGFSAWLANLTSCNSSGGSSGGDTTVFDGEVDVGSLWENVASTLSGAWEFILGSTIILALIVFAALTVIALVVLMTWIGSRGKLIFLDNVVQNRAEIVEPWKRFRELGNSLFLFRVGLGMVQLLVFTVMIVSTVWLSLSFRELWYGPSAHILVLLGIGMGSLWLLLIVSFALINFFLDGFVVPIMYRFDLKAMAAWERFLPLLSSHLGSFILCALFLLLLMILVMTAILVVGVMTCCIGLVLVAIPYVGTVLLLPLFVTYRAFTVNYLGQLDPNLDLIPKEV